MNWFERHIKPHVIAILRRPSDLPVAIIAAIVVAPIVGVYKVLFSWWLDERLAKRNDQRFAQEIRGNLAFLFNEYGAQFVANARETPAYFDWAQATVEADDLLFMFSRDHGRTYARVAPKRAPKCAQELSAVLTAIAVEASEQEVEFARLPTIGTRARTAPRWDA